MAKRKVLPTRRENFTAVVIHNNQKYFVTVGFYPDGRAGEVFTHGSKIGSDMEAVIDDACTYLSILLQYGVSGKSLVKSMSRTKDGPSSILGALVDYLATLEDNGPTEEKALPAPEGEEHAI